MKIISLRNTPGYLEQAIAYIQEHSLTLHLYDYTPEKQGELDLNPSKRIIVLMA